MHSYLRQKIGQAENINTVLDHFLTRQKIVIYLADFNTIFDNLVMAYFMGHPVSQ